MSFLVAQQSLQKTIYVLRVDDQYVFALISDIAVIESSGLKNSCIDINTYSIMGASKRNNCVFPQYSHILLHIDRVCIHTHA